MFLHKPALKFCVGLESSRALIKLRFTTQGRTTCMTGDSKLGDTQDKFHCLTRTVKSWAIHGHFGII